MPHIAPYKPLDEPGGRIAFDPAYADLNPQSPEYGRVPIDTHDDPPPTAIEWDPPATAKSVCLADVPERPVDWLWPGRIPLGKVTLLIGDPGVGKSLLALDVAARVTSGNPWPGDCPEFAQSAEQIGTVPLGAEPNDETRMTNEEPVAPPHSSFDIRHSSFPAFVLLLSAEDDLADTIRPRLEAAGADCARVIAIPPGGAEAGPSRVAAHAPPPSCDLRRSAKQIDRVLDGLPDCRLVIIDPLSAYLGRGVENFNAEVRRQIAPLANLAARRRLAVVAISHLRKQQGAALYRTIGSLAHVAVARTAWLIAADPGDPARRLMLPMKNNLAARGKAMSFQIASASTGGPPIINWSPNELTLSADEALNPPKLRQTQPPRPHPELDDAVRWLRNTLAAGVQPSRRIENQALAHGIRRITLRRAFRELGGEAVKTGFALASVWHWRLPGVGVQEPVESDDHLWEF